MEKSSNPYRVEPQGQTGLTPPQPTRFPGRSDLDTFRTVFKKQSAPPQQPPAPICAPAMLAKSELLSARGDYQEALRILKQVLAPQRSSDLDGITLGYVSIAKPR